MFERGVPLDGGPMVYDGPMFAGPMFAGPMYMHHGWGFGAFGHLFGLIFFLLVLFVLARVLSRALGWAGAGRGPSWSRMTAHAWMPRGFGRDDALETARERLARSELSPEQFEEIRRGLHVGFERPEPSKPWVGLGRDGALELARMRFARGEISAEEFELIRKTLA